MKKINIAVDGPAGSGKSATMKIVAKKLGYVFLDTGLMYRAFTWLCNYKKIDFDQEEMINKALNDFDFMILNDKIVVNGHDVTNFLTSSEIILNINKVTTKKVVRDWMVEKQRNMVQGRGFVVVGRDIASIVLPDAELKIYLDSSVDARALRRFKQNQEQNVFPNSFEEIKIAIEKRDYSDMKRSEGPLIITSDAILIDNSNLSIDEVVKMIMNLVENIIF
ncbi:cytidylate kinase [Spiroplasma sabaudiense Ar-1343]|uniref:Cytidylate kinase n=1 Tax=Spiroplasma sabaudiense Ar-1343 TaxID=1276257 RepID=W6AIX8_9MOLU|nr:(d)CMP kinase [Spiroplasma sabaudiense]AHI53664.1 cytidylate kinase [Spiroplasma sabaudiense Ar-1343]